VNGVDIHFSSFAFVIIKTCCKDVTCVFVIFYELQHETVIFRFFSVHFGVRVHFIHFVLW